MIFCNSKKSNIESKLVYDGHELEIVENFNDLGMCLSYLMASSSNSKTRCLPGKENIVYIDSKIEEP
jgi:hypothetical protein